MSTIQTAFQKVGYRPATKRKHALEKVVRKLLLPLTRPRRIQVQRAGSYYKARWEGNSDFVFGTCAGGAIERLRSGHLRSRTTVLEQ